MGMDHPSNGTPSSAAASATDRRLGPHGVRIRIAPSPTGYFHVGNARTALFNWLFARHTGGTFVLRIEDTDRTRFVPDALDDILASLRWLGIEPDEGPGIGGHHGPYLQSERLPLYRRHIEPLLAAGHAYRCFCSAERLRQVRESRQASGQKLGYDRRCRNLGADQVAARLAAGEPHVVRLKLPLAGTITLRDVIRGAIAFDATEIEDVVLIKSDGYPTYHFAVVVDDHLMEITHVLRADDWIPSAPIQVQLYHAFGWPEPVWAHVPLVLDPDGGKLSKRKKVRRADGRAIDVMTQVRDYRAAGYLPEAMFNFLALLGWSYGAEEDLFTPADAVARFRVEDIKPSPATWNPEKLDWMNGVYIRALSPEALADRLLPFLEGAGLPAVPDEVRAMVPLIQERLTTLADAPGLLAFFWSEDLSPTVDDLLPKGLDAVGTRDLLAAAESALAAVEPWDPEAIEAALRALAERQRVKPGVAFQPVRVAVTGGKVSPPLFETLAVLGRAKTLARLASARGRLAVARAVS